METTAHDVRGSKSQVKNYYNCINMKAEAEPPVHTMTMPSLSFLRFPKIFVSLPPRALSTPPSFFFLSFFLSQPFFFYHNTSLVGWFTYFQAELQLRCVEIGLDRYGVELQVLTKNFYTSITKSDFFFLKQRMCLLLIYWDETIMLTLFIKIK